MTRLYIICEGQSEAVFVEQALAPYLNTINSNLIISAPILKAPNIKDQSHKGGRVNYARLKNYAEKFSKQQCMITTLVDYYGLENDFPNYDNIQQISDIYNQVEYLECEVKKQLKLDNFIPYFQIHEYEMFYFADVDNFINVDPQLVAIKNKFIEINKDFQNPELINNSKTTAPLKRISALFEQVDLKYKKPYYAELYADKCDINLLRSKCSHFTWIDKLIKL